MTYPDIFSKQITKEIIERIEKLLPESKPKWGKMNVSQMLAHCNVTYEMAFENIHPKPNLFLTFILKLLVKNTVVNEKPYKQNGSTAPQFVIKEDKDFEVEKKRLINYLNEAQVFGHRHFDQKESHSFGPLSVAQWNNMFYKHLDHHLNQFGV